MSVALYCWTVAPIGGVARAALRQMPDDGLGPWWCEGLNFHDAGDDRLVGRTKLFRTQAWTDDGTVVAVDLAENMLMAWYEIRRIIARLSLWSKQHGMIWELTIDDASFGQVTPAGADAELVSNMRQLLASSDLASDESQAVGEVARILAKYPLPS